jgi:hypothetical protein
MPSKFASAAGQTLKLIKTTPSPLTQHDTFRHTSEKEWRQLQLRHAIIRAQAKKLNSVQQRC